jgi:hypothetical protein
MCPIVITERRHKPIKETPRDLLATLSIPVRSRVSLYIRHHDSQAEVLAGVSASSVEPCEPVSWHPGKVDG